MLAQSVHRALAAEEGRREHRPVRARQADILRDLFGPLPFRPVESKPGEEGFPPGIRSMAQQMLDERAFGHLPILADALEDAGCADASLLGHLRGPGPHVHGCWAIDHILGLT
jgi:hypothetical protein